jgi:hypothetical protein
MATNNKKSRTKKSDKIATKTPAMPSQEAAQDPKAKGLSPAQFAGLLFLGLNIVYLVEFNNALKEGAGSLACAGYVVVVDPGDDYKCTELDMATIRVKHYGGISVFLSVFLAMLLCWTEEPLFRRLTFFLCSTSWALFTMRSLLGNGASKNLIVIMTCVLFAMSFTAARSGLAMAKPKQLTGSFQDAALLSFLVITCRDAVFLTMNGVEGYLQVSEEYVSSAAEVLMPFVAIDKLTHAVLVSFILFFFDENRKRVSSFEIL